MIPADRQFIRDVAIVFYAQHIIAAVLGGVVGFVLARCF